ncbi:Tetratricopeptide repeat protein 16 [Podochytrium sp. JEL0797]|nr:Tetratricopeptide repeat protein 16 [Podochytrium sp. JEL0797]
MPPRLSQSFIPDPPPVRKSIVRKVVKKESPALKLVMDRANELNNLSLEKLYPPTPTTDDETTRRNRSTKDVHTAIASLSRAIFLNNNEPIFYIHKAHAFLLVNDFESCIANMRQAQDMLKPRAVVQKWKPEVGAIWRGIATAEDGEGEGDLFFRRDKFEATASSSNWFNIRLRRIYYTFGQILLDQRRLYEAMKYFKLARDYGMCEYSVYLRMVAIYIGLHKSDLALELLYRLIEKFPTNPDLYILRAKLYSELKHVDLVSIDLHKVVRLAPQHPEIKQLMEYTIWTAIKYKNKASLQILHGQFDVATFFLNHALELDPTDWITLMKRGVVFSEMGHYESALADLMCVLEMDERDKERDSEINSYIGSVYNRLGVEHFLNQSYEDAVTALKSALKFTSTEGIIFKNLADCYEKLHQGEQHEICLSRALHLNPTDDESRQKLAHLYFQRGESAIFAGHCPYGLIELSKAIDLDPTVPEYIFERGRTHLLTEQIDSAREDLTRVLKMDPLNREAAAMLDQLTLPPQKGSDVIKKLKESGLPASK